MRPSDYFQTWTEFDRGMARGFLAHEAATNRYGVARDRAEDPDTEGWWKVELPRDYADEAVSAVRDALDKDDARRHATPRVYLDPEYRPRGP